MDRETGERIIKTLQAMTPAIDELDTLSHRIMDQEERRAYRRKLAELLSLVGYDLLMPVVKQFPDLDPDRPARLRDGA
ncbi:MAG: hypothetical protein JNN33_16380 [Rhodospirillaceae bacterium]|jgi:hypothetical protein|nr:hypothetical protein [Rhodospirillaceae bacterium]